MLDKSSTPRGNMNLTTLENTLKAEQIPTNAYTILSKPKDETLCIESSKEGWIVFYSERGLRSGEKFFSSENDACQYFIERIRSWFKNR